MGSDCHEWNVYPKHDHKNGNKYLALYTKSGKFVGYINTKAAKVVK